MHFNTFLRKYVTNNISITVLHQKVLFQGTINEFKSFYKTSQVLLNSQLSNKYYVIPNYN